MRVRRSMLNFGTSILLMVVTMGVGLKATPLLIGWLNERRYGGFRVVSEAYGYLTLLELGLGGALGPLLARALGGDDDRALRGTLAAGVRAYTRVALFTVLVGLAVTPLVPLLAGGMAPSELTDLRVGWVIGLASFLSLALVPARSLIESAQAGYVVNLLLIAQSLLITGLSLVLARADWGITGQALARVVGVWAFGLATAAIALRARPGLLRAVLIEPVGPETRGALRTLSVPTLVLNVSGRVSVLTDNLVVGGILGVTRVTSLVNTQLLVTTGQTLLQSVGNATWAALAELHVRGERETFNRRLIEMTRLVAVLAAVGFVPVVAFNRPFVRLWLGPGFRYGGDLVVVVASINGLLLAEQSLWAWCFTATGKVREVIAPALGGAVINLAASVTLTYKIGLAGPLLGTMVAFVMVGLWVLPLRLNRAFGTPIGPLLRAVAMPAALGSVAGAILWRVGLDHPPETWSALVAAMGGSSLAVLALALALLMSGEDRAVWRQRLAGMFGRGRVGPRAAVAARDPRVHEEREGSREPV